MNHIPHTIRIAIGRPTAARRDSLVTVKILKEKTLQEDFSGMEEHIDPYGEDDTPRSLIHQKARRESPTASSSFS